MKHLKLFESFSDVESICKKYGIKNYTINSDGSVDVDGNVSLYKMELTKIPLKFNRVTGGFYCSNNELTSLEGAPKEVGGDFYCSNNKLISLEGCPREVGVNFNCFYNELTNLIGSPKEVGGNFTCSHNQLTSLEGGPKKVGGDFYCSDNPLPKEILDNDDYIKYIINNQDDYSIWKADGILDLYRFHDMMEDKNNE